MNLPPSDIVNGFSFRWGSSMMILFFYDLLLCMYNIIGYYTFAMFSTVFLWKFKLVSYIITQRDNCIYYLYIVVIIHNMYRYMQHPNEHYFIYHDTSLYNFVYTLPIWQRNYIWLIDKQTSAFRVANYLAYLRYDTYTYKVFIYTRYYVLCMFLLCFCCLL